MKKTWLTIAFLVLAALGVRLIIAFNTYIISSDGPLYIEAATYYYQGDFKNALSHPYHPLYPFLISLCYRLVGNWEWAGMLISVLLGSLTIIPLYLLSLRLAHNQTIAFITGIFYIFHPHSARLSASILTTGTYIFILVMVLYLLTRALEDKNALSLILTGLFTLLAFLTRPDGVVLLLICLGWVVLVDVRGWWQGALKKRLSALIWLLMPWLIGAIPYIGYLISQHGEFTISHKLNLSNLKDILTPVIRPEAFYIAGSDFIKSAHPWLLLLIIIGIIIPKKDLEPAIQRRRTYLVWSVFLTYFLVLLKFADVFSRVSTRYTTPLVVIITFWGALGLYILVMKMIGIKDKIKSDSLLFIKWLGVGTAITTVSFAVFTFQPVGKERIGERKIAEWLKQYHQSSEPPIIVANSNRIPYYGGGKIIAHYEGTHLKGFGTNYKELLQKLRNIKANYLIVEKNKINKLIADFDNQVTPAELELIYPLVSTEVVDAPKAFRVYRLKY